VTITGQFSRVEISTGEFVHGSRVNKFRQDIQVNSSEREY